MVILVGAPGSGKSTFCQDVMKISSRPWVRVCQVSYISHTRCLMKCLIEIYSFFLFMGMRNYVHRNVFYADCRAVV